MGLITSDFVYSILNFHKNSVFWFGTPYELALLIVRQDDSGADKMVKQRMGFFELSGFLNIL